jgi:hypothetical protein
LILPAESLSYGYDRNTRQGPRFLISDEQAGHRRCGQLVCGLCPADVMPQRQLICEHRSTGRGGALPIVVTVLDVLD